MMVTGVRDGVMIYVTFHLFLSPSTASTSGNNQLCDLSSWNVIEGYWTFNPSACLLSITDPLSDGANWNDIVWLGSADGQTPDYRFCHESFQLTLMFAVHSGFGRAGLLFRVKEVSSVQYDGGYYHVRLSKWDPSQDKVQIGWANNTHWMSEGFFNVDDVDWDTVHNLTVIARATLYDVYFDDDAVVENYNMSQFTNFNESGIGLRAAKTNATFYSLAYTPITSQPTLVPTINPINDPTNVPSINPATSQPTLVPTMMPTIAPSIVPTNPTTNPSIQPTTSPTRYPIEYSTFQFKLYGHFTIYHLSHDALDLIDYDLDQQIVDFTEMIHRGMDKDDYLEYKQIVLNISSINGYAIEDMMSGRAEKLALSLVDGMSLIYLIEFENYWKYTYVLSDEYDHSILEQSVTGELRASFETADDGDIVFMVQSFNATFTAITTLPPGSLSSDSSSVSTPWTTLYAAVVSIATILLILCVVIIYWRRRKKRSMSPLCISNALVAMISIGDYSDSVKVNEADKDVPGVYQNLEVEKDIETLKELSKFMNWTFTSKRQKVHWTEKEIISFIETEIGEMICTADGALNYDGLIVFISSHGIKDNVVTSDFKAMEKTAIHRMLSLKHPKLRDIPRIFVFDCCNGSDERRGTIGMTIDTRSDQSKVMERANLDGQNKGIALDDVHNLKMNAWTSKTKNPDYNLVEVHAANSGYVAKMSYEGSYLVDVLAQGISRNVETNMNQGLAELLEEVQNTLHDTGHQQTVNILNNHTRSMVFKKNPRK